MEKSFNRKLDFGYSYQSTDEQISDIWEPSHFRLQHWVVSIDSIGSLNIALNESSQFLHETINGYASYSRDVHYTKATILKYHLLSLKQAYRKNKSMFNSVSINYLINGAACSVLKVLSRTFHIEGTVPVSVTRVSVKR